MIVKNIIINACELMNKKDVISYLKGETELNEEIEEALNDLMVAVNIANNSIASNYIPIKNVVKLKNSQGMILFKNMSDKDILEIYSIKKNNNKVSNYKLVSKGIVIENGDYEIEFSVFPDEVEIDGEIDYYFKINDFVFAQLVVSEYYFLKGFNDEANIWDSRFHNQIKSLLRVKKNILIPEERWL
jgi:hypothetical protein